MSEMTTLQAEFIVKVASYTCRYIGNVSLRDDFKSYVVLQICKRFSRQPAFEDHEHFKRWTYTVARNVRMDYWRNYYTNGGLLSKTVSLDQPLTDSPDSQTRVEPVDLEPTPYNKTLTADQFRSLAEAVNRLPEELRHPVLEHYMNGKKLADIAAASNISHCTVINRIAKAFKLIRKRLAA